jgi:phosphate-selective porin OprO/OprP
MREYYAPLALAALIIMPAPGPAAAKPELDLSAKDGIELSASDSDFSLELGGRVTADTVSWDADSAVETAIGEQTGASEFRRARLYMAGTIYGYVIFKAQYEFAGDNADFKEVYLGIKDIPRLGTVKVGHFKEPFSLEELTSSKYITFMERSLPGVFAPSRNTGLGFHSTALDDRLTLAAGLFHDSDGIGDSGDKKLNFSARVTGTPIKEDGSLLHLGLSWTSRDPEDDLLRLRQRPEVHLADRFVDTGSLAAEGMDVLGLEAAVVLGPLSLQGEYMAASLDIAGGSDADLSGWYAYASWFVTGESRAYKAGKGVFSRVRPADNFTADGGSGALELAVRLSNLDLNDAGAGISGGELDDLTLGVNWYLDPATRVMLNWVNADIRGLGEANALQARFQVDF